MKKYFALLSVIFFSLSISGFAQMGSAKQVKWTYDYKKIGEKKYEVKMTATIAGNYHLYAQVAGVEGPQPTTITFNPNPLLTNYGKTLEVGNKITKYEKDWDGNVFYYEKTVTFVQIVNAKTKAKTSVNGKIVFMVCNDEHCLPPAEEPFKIAIGG
jgi:thiol:disulfide interchange protein DsbD